MKVVILCGGKGTRLREETEFRPKPMVPIGERPILWHIMKTYAHHGFKEFVLCLGYKGEMIKEYFRNYLWNTCDTTLYLGHDPAGEFHTRHTEEDWQVTLADTGEESMTGDASSGFRNIWGRRHVSPHLWRRRGEHRYPGLDRVPSPRGKICTLTAVHPPGRFGELGMNEDTTVHGFNEKPQTESGYINGGYMVCSRASSIISNAIPVTMLNRSRCGITCEGKLGAYKHEGFWQPMDTFQEFTCSTRLWAEGRAPWKVW